MKDSRKTRSLILLSLLSVAGGCSSAAPSAISGDSSGTLVQAGGVPSRSSGEAGRSPEPASDPRVVSAAVDGGAGTASAGSSGSLAAGTGGSAGRGGRGGSGGATPTQMQPSPPPADDDDDEIDEAEDDEDGDD
jgi:hypothetical protein